VLDSHSGYFFVKRGRKLTKKDEDFTIDALSRLGANSIAQSLREKYADCKHFKAEVFMFPYGKAGNFCYVVRTNLVNGMPPTKPTKIKPPDAAFLRKSAPNTSQVAA
jgi:hypothetical protein